MNRSWSRALVITPTFDGPDGVSTVARAYVEAMLGGVWGAASAGPRLDVWSLADRGRPEWLSLEVGFRGAAGRRPVFASYALRERRIDRGTLVIAQHVPLMPAVLPLIARGARVMLLLHGIESWKRLRALERIACRRAWKLAAVSSHTVRRFKEANPDLADVAVDVCAPGLPSRTPADAAPARTAGASPGDVPGPYALIVGRMSAAERYKGHDDLIEIWPAVRAAIPGAHLVIVGGGDDVSRLVQKAAGLGVLDAVRFEGTVDEARLSVLYRNASVFVMPSANEGFGLVYVEAMRAGVPCIVAEGAAEEIVEHERTGLVVSAGDRIGLARAIIRLMTSDEDRARMSDAALAASSRFTAEAFAARLEGMLVAGC